MRITLETAKEIVLIFLICLCKIFVYFDEILDYEGYKGSKQKLVPIILPK